MTTSSRPHLSNPGRPISGQSQHSGQSWLQNSQPQVRHFHSHCQSTFESTQRTHQRAVTWRCGTCCCAAAPACAADAASAAACAAEAAFSAASHFHSRKPFFGTSTRNCLLAKPAAAAATKFANRLRSLRSLRSARSRAGSMACLVVWGSGDGHKLGPNWLWRWIHVHIIQVTPWQQRTLSNRFHGLEYLVSKLVCATYIHIPSNLNGLV